MKLAIRIFAMIVVIAGLTGASASSATPNAVSSHLSATMNGPGPLNLPGPGCGPGIPCLVASPHIR